MLFLYITNINKDIKDIKISFDIILKATDFPASWLSIK